VTRVVLDAGALIALERNDRGLWAVLRLAALDGADVLVPSTQLSRPLISLRSNRYGEKVADAS